MERTFRILSKLKRRRASDKSVKACNRTRRSSVTLRGFTLIIDAVAFLFVASIYASLYCCSARKQAVVINEGQTVWSVNWSGFTELLTDCYTLQVGCDFILGCVNRAGLTRADRCYVS
jgi:hypothetical protein